jgi:hypothetical protein
VSNPLDVIAKVDSLSRKLNQLMAAGFAPTSTPYTHSQHEACSFCANLSHHANDCLAVGQLSDNSHEQVNAAFARLGNDPYSNSNHLGWRNHPNFSW